MSENKQELKLDVKVDLTDEAVHTTDGEVIELTKSPEDDLDMVIDDIAKSMEELDLRKSIEKSEDLGEVEKGVLLKLVKEDGTIDFDNMMLESVRAAQTAEFKNDEGLKLLLPYLFTTDKSLITIDTPIYDLEIDGITYYLKDDFKRVAFEGVGDQEYKLYMSAPDKINECLEDKELIVDGKNKKIDVFIHYLGLLNSVEEILDEEYGKFITEHAYKSAIDKIYDKLLNSKEERKKLIENSYGKIKKRNLSELKGYFFNKMFKHLKKIPASLRTDFSTLMDYYSNVFILAYLRTIENDHTSIDEMAEQQEKGNSKLTKGKTLALQYAIIAYLSKAYTDPKIRWTFVSLEKEVVEKNAEESYLYKVFVDVLNKIIVENATPATLHMSTDQYTITE